MAENNRAASIAWQPQLLLYRVLGMTVKVTQLKMLSSMSAASGEREGVRER